MRIPAALALLVFAAGSTTGASGRAMQNLQKPMFHGGVNLVIVTVVVQRKNGQPVTGLTRRDFQLFDDGQPREIADFRAEPSPVRVALLIDQSGSMGLATRMADARSAARHVMSCLEPDRDHVALFGFDTTITEIAPFTAPRAEIDRGLDALTPFGETSLYDAIAGAGRRLATEDGPRRAVVAITDGADTSSHMRPLEVALLASGIDVPVYVIAVVLPIDRASGRASAGNAESMSNPLAALARATGGQWLAVSSEAHRREAACQVVSDLRSEYVLAFEPDPAGRSGFRSIKVITRDTQLIVRTRGGYVAGSTITAHH
jgi:VWFA-related protein